MTRIWLLAGVLGIIAVLSSGLWLSINKNADLRSRLAACGGTITETEKFNEGASNPDGLGWYERLFGTTAAE